MSEPTHMSSRKRDQVAGQYGVVAHLAERISTIHSQLLSMIPQAPEGVIEIMGERSARLMEVLGDILNGMDATEPADRWFDPIYEKAHAMFPCVEDKS